MSAKRHTSKALVRLNLEGNNGGSFVDVELTKRPGVVRLRVGHDCVHRVDCLVSVFALASVLTNAFDQGFRRLVEAENGGKVPEWAEPVCGEP